VANQVSNLAKHTAKQVVQEPMEIAKNAVGASDNSGENQAMQAMEQGHQGQQQANDPQSGSSDPKGFKTLQDFQKYQQLSPKKDEMELAILRKKMHQEYGLESDVEAGMQKAHMEREQKMEERKQVDEQKKEEKKMVDLQVKKQEEDLAIKAATQASSAENQAWGAG